MPEGNRASRSPRETRLNRGHPDPAKEFEHKRASLVGETGASNAEGLVARSNSLRQEERHRERADV